ncbi:ArsR/SmtB family transcription factor [Luteipulveratus mongoliensis]|uniref:ArsR/SmtB family transcription factor n=1 Tax=Luteipulveratus mongoliensis TaxID=571913 RepID=UPI000698CD84|nr:winged helix-turn-helix domain-containing protein [Luteipulveratus mongoliensis]
MIELELTATDLARVRFTSDAVWETTSSLSLINHRQHFQLHRHLRPRIPSDPDFDLDLLLELTSPEHFTPDLLGPTPTARAGHPLDQFERLADTPDEVLESDVRALRELLPGSRAARMTGRELAERTAAAMAAYWQSVLEPLWPRLEAIVGADIAHRSVALASEGLERALDELHDSIAWTGSGLRIALADSHIRLPSACAGLWLVPLVFRGPTVMLADTSTPPVIAYAARGAGQLWERPVETIVGGIDALIGTSRAAILAQLDIPRTTTALATAVGLSAGTVSQHLAVLVSAGLCTSRRDGRRVLYARTERADLLLDIDAAQAR